MWIARSHDGGTWAKQRKPSLSEIIAATGLFEPAVQTADARRMTLPAETVIGLENTRATSLSWPDEVREEFVEEMRGHLRQHAEVRLTQETSLTMARVRQSAPA